MSIMSRDLSGEGLRLGSYDLAATPYTCYVSKGLTPSGSLKENIFKVVLVCFSRDPLGSSRLLPFIFGTFEDLLHLFVHRLFPSSLVYFWRF